MATRTSEQSRKVKVKGKEARAARRSVCNSFTTYTAFQVVPGLEKRSKQKIKKSTFLELGHQNYDKKTIKWRCTFFLKLGPP